MTWIDVGSVKEITRRRKLLVVPEEAPPIAVFAHHDQFFALDNICIHKQRELVKGVIMGDRVVCPGHQWSFDLATGWEAKMGRCQPCYDVRVVDDRVEVDVSSRRTLDAPPNNADGETVVAPPGVKSASVEPDGAAHRRAGTGARG